MEKMENPEMKVKFRPKISLLRIILSFSDIFSVFNF